jgi:hypothetical protein
VLSADVGDVRTQALCLHALGDAYRRLGETNEARRSWLRATALYRRLGVPVLA